MNALLQVLFNIVKSINEYIFEPLNNATRIDAYIGILGVLVAIVLFVAETINNTKTETQKKFILEKTKIKKTMVISIVILTFGFVKDIIPYRNDSSFVEATIFFFKESLFNCLIIYSIILTILVFVRIIKLNTDSEKFNNEYNEYLKGRLQKIHSNNIRNTQKRLKNGAFERFVKNNSRIISLDTNNTQGYVPIKANKNGVFKIYDFRILQKIVNKIEKRNIYNKKEVLNEKISIILPLKGGEKINRGVTIAYCEKSILDFENIIKDCCVFEDSIPYLDNEINLIIKDLYFLAQRNMNDNFDEDMRLFNFYSFLYKNNMRAILEQSYEYIRKVFIDCYNDKNKIAELAKFLNLLAHLAYDNKDYERYKYLNDYTYYCHKNLLTISEDTREVAYDFTHDVIKYEYYSVKENNDAIYYDVLMSNFLRFIFDLIEINAFDAIEDLFQNVIFDYDYTIKEEPNSYDVVKIQFTFGFIYGLIFLSTKGIINGNNIDNIEKLISNIKRNFVRVYNQNDVIKYIRKYFNYNSNVQNVYDHFIFRFEETKYKDSFSHIPIDETDILNKYVELFDVDYARDDKIDPELISKDNLYFYEKLMNILESKERDRLDKLLNIVKPKESFYNLIVVLKQKCEDAKNEYIRKNKIKEETKKAFIDDILENIKKGNELISYLQMENQYGFTKKKGRSSLIINKIIGREYFFEESKLQNIIAQNYGRAIVDGITDEYCKALDDLSIVINQDFFDYTKNKNLEDYIIITSHLNYTFLGVKDFQNCQIEINGKFIKIVQISNISEIYLVKKKDLPKIEMLLPDFKGEGIIENNIYCELIDCATDEIALNEIQKNTEWLKEKGSIEEQKEFLKGNCVIKVFASPLIKSRSNSKCYKFIVNNW